MAIGTFREWLNEKEGKESYKEFFAKKLEKFGVKSASELTGDDKKKFFDEVDAEWKGEKEEPEVGDKDVNESADKAKKFMKEFNLSVSLLKEDIKLADKNQDWYARLEYISILISKELKNR